jgi:tRNA threonylcarbamoyladenosine biosynthesis protein TsaE
MTVELILKDEAATIDLGQKLVAGPGLGVGLGAGDIIFLSGELGAGKTTLTRGLLRALGVTGPIKSPTYTLVEPYDLGQLKIYHFDLYRLTDPEELLDIGLSDYLDTNALLLIEWPERAETILPRPSLRIELILEPALGRRVLLSAETPTCERLINTLK